MICATGPDISTWQESPAISGEVDFPKMSLLSDFLILKKSQAWYQDPDFLKFSQQSKPFFNVRGAYHYMTWETPVQAQVTALLANLTGFQFVIVDYESRTHIPAVGTARAWLHEFLLKIEQQSNFPPSHILIYTSPGYWAEYGSPDSWWGRYPLWIAHYQVSAPTIPPPWSNYLFWQYTDRGDGLAYGVESKQIDLNQSSLTPEQLQTWAGVTPIPPEPPKPPESEAMKFIVQTAGLRVRAEPNTNSPVLRQLSTGQQVEADTVYAPPAGAEAWAHIGDGWAAIVYGGSQHMRSA